METAVVLVSGGINSAVAAAAAREQYDAALLHVGWGHRTAERELIAFQQIAAALRIERTLVADLNCLASIGGNARTSKRLAVEDAQTLGRTTPATFMTGLMPSMLSVAVSWAGVLGAKRVIVGISENHGVPGPLISELYPDRRREFIQAYNLMLHYAKPSQRELLVEAPLLEMSRVEVLRLGEQCGVPFDKTWSCYRSIETPCGRCHPCVTRIAGFMQAKMPDPLLLEPAEARA